MIKEIELFNTDAGELIKILSTVPPETKIEIEGCSSTINIRQGKDYLIFS